jgi:hypothetical protein
MILFSTSSHQILAICIYKIFIANFIISRCQALAPGAYMDIATVTQGRVLRDEIRIMSPAGLGKKND